MFIVTRCNALRPVVRSAPMDAVILDDEIAPALAAFPITSNLSVEALPAMRETRAADVRRHRAVGCGRAHRARGQRRPARRRPRAPTEGRGRPAPVHLLDPRRRIHRGLVRHGRRQVRPPVRALPVRRRVGRVPARTGDAVPGAARRLLRGSAVDARARGRARHRARPHRHLRSERGWRTRRRARAARPRSGRGADRVPVARVPDDRRPPDHVVEPARRPPDLEPGVERVRLAELPR